jgi:hypothetical protein
LQLIISADLINQTYPAGGEKKTPEAPRFAGEFRRSKKTKYFFSKCAVLARSLLLMCVGGGGGGGNFNKKKKEKKPDISGQRSK